MLKRLRHAVLPLLALAAAGCAAAPPAAPEASPVASPAALASRYPSPGAAGGAIAGVPFTVRTVLFWQDETAAWLSFEDTVPQTGGRFDPRATRPPTTSFLLYLDVGHLRPGRFEAREGRTSPDSPIRFAALQQVNAQTHEIRLFDEGWQATLTIDQIVQRRAGGGAIWFNLAGTIDLRFTTPAATLSGPFVAHDLLRDDEVAPDQPRVPAPTSPGRTE